MRLAVCFSVTCVRACVRAKGLSSPVVTQANSIKGVTILDSLLTVHKCITLPSQVQKSLLQ